MKPKKTGIREPEAGGVVADTGTRGKPQARNREHAVRHRSFAPAKELPTRLTRINPLQPASVFSKRGVKPRGGRVSVRNYAGILTAFIASFGFPSPPRDGCPDRVVRCANRGHVLSDIIAQNRPVLSHFLAYYRSERICNKEIKRRMKSGTETDAGVAGRSRAGTRLKDSKPPASAHLNPLKTALARLGPPSPTLIFPSGAWNQYGKWSAGVLGRRGRGAARTECSPYLTSGGGHFFEWELARAMVMSRLCAR